MYYTKKFVSNTFKYKKNYCIIAIYNYYNKR